MVRIYFEDGQMIINIWRDVYSGCFLSDGADCGVHDSEDFFAKDECLAFVGFRVFMVSDEKPE